VPRPGEETLVRCESARSYNEGHQAARVEGKPGQAGAALGTRGRVVFSNDTGPWDAIVSGQPVRVAEAILRFVSRVVAVLEQPIKGGLHLDRLEQFSVFGMLVNSG
jgi:hypothetical protein